METKREQELIGILLKNSVIGISEIQSLLTENISTSTLNRALAKLKTNGILTTNGKGPSLKYSLNLKKLINLQINLDIFFGVEPDERNIINNFNFEIFDKLKNLELFNASEIVFFESLKNTFQQKTVQLTPNQFNKEFERLMVELSWKSAQIEGNTYDLIDTEQLLKYNIPSLKHTFDETQMLLNHKEAINYTYQNRDIFENLSVGKIVDIHSLLTQKMGISRNPRKRIVRITGTKYLPPENDFLIEEALEKMCELINAKSNIFEKAFLAVLLISYIQPFEDGNKRTARLIGNAFLMYGNTCPLSYRSINPAEYKKAILLFYELNNISAFRKIFINQYQFAVENYF
ncbi:MAG: cell filamentation protein Fic [Sphingobacteriales bacterium]|nr:MAG: cell filamentation protein Fic [Sphingobacteriales bacterium]